MQPIAYLVRPEAVGNAKITHLHEMLYVYGYILYTYNEIVVLFQHFSVLYLKKYMNKYIYIYI